MKNLDDKINIKIDKTLKELLELINKKSENELIIRSLKIDTSSTLDDTNVLNTEYNINFVTVLTEKEVLKWVKKILLNG